MKRTRWTWVVLPALAACTPVDRDRAHPFCDQRGLDDQGPTYRAQCWDTPDGRAQVARCPSAWPPDAGPRPVLETARTPDCLDDHGRSGRGRSPTCPGDATPGCEPSPERWLRGDEVMAESSLGESVQGAPHPLGNQAILAEMRSNIPEFKACMRLQLKQDPSVRGKLVIAFTIQPDGTVSDARVDQSTGTFEGTFVAACLCDVIGVLRFPAFEGPPRVVKMPFRAN